MKREDGVGLGRREARYRWDEKWWEGSFANAAEKIARVMGKGDSDAASTSESASESASDAARGETATGRDGVACSGSKSELKLMEELARDNHRGSTFGGRVGKLERIARFEAEQLAKYGIQRGSAV